MNRRNFLGMLAASFALDPDRLLWVPGKKLISIPQTANVELAIAEEAFSSNVVDFFVSRSTTDKYGPKMWPPAISDAEAIAAARAEGKDFVNRWDFRAVNVG